MTETPRSQWGAALETQLPRVQSLGDRLTEGWTVRHVAIPKSGLMLLRMEEAVLGEDFYLGEIPVAYSRVELELPDGTVAQGGAQILDDAEANAVAFAVCDAVLSAELPGADEVRALVEEGAEELRQRDKVRRGMLSRTQVDFSLLMNKDVDGESTD